MGEELQSFAIVAGALGIGVGFGLQNVVNSFASGLILLFLFERPVRVRDTVVVGDIRLRMEMRSAVPADIDRRLREAGIQIPFPQRDLHLRSVDGEVLGGLDEDVLDRSVPVQDPVQPHL